MSAKQLPPGLYEAFLESGLEATAHVESNWGPAILEVKLFRRDPLQPITWSLKLLKEWRKTP